jgi:hypothetical protein
MGREKSGEHALPTPCARDMRPATFIIKGSAGLGEVQTHVPLRQVRPELHILPHPPQFRGSLRTFTHALPQRLVSAPHAQVPLLHDAPPAQARPH